MVAVLPQLGFTLVGLGLTDVATFAIVNIMQRTYPGSSGLQIAQVLGVLVGVPIKYFALVWGGVWGGGKSGAALFFLLMSTLQVLASMFVIYRVVTNPVGHEGDVTVAKGKEFSLMDLVLGQLLAGLLTTWEGKGSTSTGPL